MTPTEGYLSDAWIHAWEDRLKRRGNFIYTPEKSALLLIDLQNYFLNPKGKAFIEPSRRIVRKLLDLAAAYRERGLTVVLTRHVDDPARHPLMAQWWQSALAAEDPDSRLIPELDPFLETSVIIQKCRYDSFQNTGLSQILGGRGVNQVVIGGVMAHLCCETTARAAFARDLLPFFLLDGTAADEAENHEGTLLNLQHGFAVLSTCGEILSAVKGR
jgi:bifunctional isochorismate lyase/aryl carrier protein